MAAVNLPLPLPPNPPAVALPAQPNDPNVQLPAAPVFPPTVNNVLTAVKYRQNVDVSIAERPPLVRCTPNDRYNSILYEHSVISQAAAAAGPQGAAPPWFQNAIQLHLQQLRADIRNDMRAEIVPDLKRLMNQRRGEGFVVAFEIVPFVNGSDPTQPPVSASSNGYKLISDQNNLLPLHSVNDIDNLNGHDLVRYLNGYGIVPPVGLNPHATNRLRKDTLKGFVGVS